MTTWGFTLEDSTGLVLGYTNSLSNMTLTMPLNGPATLSASIAHNSTDQTVVYNQLGTGALFLRAARDGTTRFYGVLNDMQTSLGDTGETAMTFTDLSGVLASVSNYTISSGRIKPYYKRTPTWTTVIDEMLAKPSSLSPIARLTRSGTRSGHVPSNDVLESGSGKRIIKTNIWKPQSTSVLETLQELSGFADGIEWYVSPDNTFTMAQTLGSDVSDSVFFDYGRDTRGNVQSVDMQFQPPVNDLFWVDTSSNVHRSRSGYLTSSISTFGDYSTTYNSMARRNQSDEDRASSRARANWRFVTSLIAEPLKAPSPWTDYFLGDTVSVRIKKDALELQSGLRVNQLVITTDAQNAETSHELTFEVL